MQTHDEVRMNEFVDPVSPLSKRYYQYTYGSFTNMLFDSSVIIYFLYYMYSVLKCDISIKCSLHFRD